LRRVDAQIPVTAGERGHYLLAEGARRPQMRRCTLLGLIIVAGCSSTSSRSTDMAAAPSDFDMSVGKADMSSTGGDLAARLGGDLGSDVDGGSNGDMTAAPTVNCAGKVVDLATGTAIAGATVCVYQHPELPCTTSDATGNFIEAMPQNAKTGFLIDATNYASILWPFQTGTTPLTVPVVLTMSSTSATQTFYAAASATYPQPNQGFLRVRFIIGTDITKGNSNSTASLVPSGGMGPLFASTSGAYDGSLTKSSSSGWLRFADLATGAFEVDGVCGNNGVIERNNGWEIDPANNSKSQAPIVSGYETYLVYSCY
jgi:hypothetical protein